jgi:hypothetical protein
MALNYNPNQVVYPAGTQLDMPDLVKPEAGITTQDAESYFDPQKATMSGQVTGLLNQGSPLIQAAQADTRKLAAQRGLLNSSMANSAGTRAAIETVSPIAQNDANMYAQFGMQNQNAYNTGQLNQQVAQLDTTKAANQTQLAGALANQANQNAMKKDSFLIDGNRVIIKSIKGGL